MNSDGPGVLEDPGPSSSSESQYYDSQEPSLSNGFSHHEPSLSQGSSSILGSDASTLVELMEVESETSSIRKRTSQEIIRDVPGLESIKRKQLVSEVHCLCSLCDGYHDVNFVDVDNTVLVKKVAMALECLTRRNNVTMRSFGNSNDINVLSEQMHMTMISTLMGMDAPAPSLLNKFILVESLVATDNMSACRAAMTNSKSLLCFHAKNVPAISIEAYMLRILKYCPVSNDVFLVLLVYFDHLLRRMYEARIILGSPISRPFGIDSLNVHRLIIAGITVASKFFSDVFYTNARYAKVGGLPVHELNQLETQFFLLNDFSLLVSKEELQRYANHLLATDFNPDDIEPSLPELPTRVSESSKSREDSCDLKSPTPSKSPNQ